MLDLQDDLVLLILFEGQRIRSELAFAALLAGGTSAWQIRSHGFRRQKIRWLEDTSFDVQGRGCPTGW
jgi:hypothetical protein